MIELEACDIIEEKNYRVYCLKKKPLEEYRIALYGIGINAKLVLDTLDIHIWGLVDAQHTGQFIYGKKVLSEDEILLLGINLIIVAADLDSTKIVYDRIERFCITNHIGLWDMYGDDLFEIRRKNLLQSLLYENMTYQSLEDDGKRADVIFITFEECLAEQMKDRDSVIEETERCLKNLDQEIPSFTFMRKKAQERMPRGMNETIDDIYTIMGTELKNCVEKLKAAKAIEKKKLFDSLRPREEMIRLVKYWLSIGKKVVVCSCLFCGEELIRAIFDAQSVRPSGILCTDDKDYSNYIMGHFHSACEKYGRQNLLCIGFNHRNEIIPYAYNIENRMIKNSVQIYAEYCSEWASGMISDRNLVENAISSPFVCEINKDRVLQALGKQTLDLSFRGNHMLPDLMEFEKKPGDISFPFEEDPLVSIIIPVYNQFAYTYCCLKSIKKYSENIPYEIILADDCSNDETAEIEKIVSGLQVIHNTENLLFLKNCNHAAKIARGKFLLFLNNDTQVQAGWLSALLDVAENKEDCGIVGSKLIYPDGSLQEAGGIIWNDGFGWNYGKGDDPDAPDYQYLRETDYISGASIMIPKKLWEQIGGFDEVFAPAYYEDTDLAFEVRRRGKKVYYQPRSVVVHFEGISNGKEVTGGVKRHQVLNREKFIRKWRNTLLTEQKAQGEHVLAACERKIGRKTVLFISETVPTYDKDAGSRTIDFYMQAFLNRDYIVKFISNDFAGVEPYTSRMEQMGIEVLAGDFYKKNIDAWLYRNHGDIDFVFANYPNCTLAYIDILKKLQIPVRYYGMDLHFIRLHREYEITGNISSEEASEECLEKEKYLIDNCDIVYYPSQVEIDIVKNQFHKAAARVLKANFYKDENIVNTYSACDRTGIMFIGGYKHAPNVDAVKWFVKDIFPYIDSKLDMTFSIIGADMPPEIANLKSEKIETIGYVTDEELEEIYKKIKLVVIPLRFGAGVKGKVIEAMFHGIPVLSTTVGMEGIPHITKADLIADDAESFRKALENIYSDHMLLNEVSCEETEIIREHYSENAAWSSIAEDF